MYVLLNSWLFCLIFSRTLSRSEGGKFSQEWVVSRARFHQVCSFIPPETTLSQSKLHDPASDTTAIVFFFEV